MAAAAGVALAAYAYLRTGATPREFEGWIEAYFIFVSPDESGRVETLSVREGDPITVGAPLFTLDAELQKAAVTENEAAVANAKVTYDRAQELLKKAVGSQKVFDDAEAALRTAEARLNSARTRLDRRRVVSPVAGIGAGDLLPRRRDGAGGTADRVAAAAGERARALLRAAGGAAAGAHRRLRSPSLATAARKA